MKILIGIFAIVVVLAAVSRAWAAPQETAQVRCQVIPVSNWGKDAQAKEMDQLFAQIQSNNEHKKNSPHADLMRLLAYLREVQARIVDPKGRQCEVDALVEEVAAKTEKTSSADRHQIRVQVDAIIGDDYLDDQNQLDKGQMLLTTALTLAVSKTKP